MVQTREERLKTRREYYQNNKEQIAEKKKEYYQNNRDAGLERARKQRANEDKEDIKEYKRKWQQEHKDEIKEKSKQYHENNKEKIHERKREYFQNTKERDREKRAEYQKIYNQTPAGIKSNKMRKWRSRGVINVTDEIYNHYIATTHCECCSKEFSSSNDRKLDHDHETGEYRQILCSSCNNHDYWKKVIG